MNDSQLADLALIPPRIDTAPASRYKAAELDYGMTIGIERTPRGRLWSCWVGGGDDDHAFMAMASSDDAGATWTDTRVVIDPHDPALPIRRRSLVANLWTDPLGRLWFFFDQGVAHFDGRAGTWATRCDNPDADQPAWTPPERLWHGCSLNKPIVTSAGEWLLPVSLWARCDITGRFHEAFQDLDPLRGANVLVSIDQGRTWRHRGGVAFPHPNFDEHNLIERRDGSIWMTARTLDSNVWESVSTDAGRSWSAPRESAIKHVNSRHFMRRLGSGNILLVKHGARVDERTSDSKPYTGRSHLCAFLSEDDGVTWKGGLMLDERHPVTYPDGTQAGDGTIYVQYDFERETTGQILFACFTGADILAGRAVSDVARFKQPIFRPQRKRTSGIKG